MPAWTPGAYDVHNYVHRFVAVTKKHSIADARSNLPRLVREAEAGEAVELTRRGEPVAVLVGRRQYERLTGQVRNFGAAFDDFSASVSLDELRIDPDEVFGDARDKTAGRAVEL